MKHPPAPLDRLFRAAARAPREHESPSTTPFQVEAGVLAALRRARAGEADEWFAFLPLFRAGLAVAASLALLAWILALRPDAPPVADETVFLNSSAIELSFLP